MIGHVTLSVAKITNLPLVALPVISGMLAFPEDVEWCTLYKNNDMKRILTFTLLLLATIAFAQSPVDSRQQEIVFKSVNVVPMNEEKVIADQTVVLRDGKIAYVGDAKGAKFSKNALIVDSKGKYLIPGLAEMHAHVPPIDDIEPMKEVLLLFAANGITTIRGMLGHPRHLELRAKINSGEIPGPHFYTTGPSFNGMSVTNPEVGSEMVRKQKEAGYDYLKLHPGLTRVKFDAVAATAKEVGIPFAGHVSFGVGVWRAIEAGYSSIDHLDGFVEALVPGIETMNEQQTGLFGLYIGDKVDESKIPALMKALKEKNVWVVPTQSLADRWFHPDFTPEKFLADPDHKYMKPETVTQWNNTKTNLMANPEYSAAKVEALIKIRRKLILECQKNGVGLLLGCDAPQVFNVPGFSTHNELEYLVASGLTPYQALQTGTTNVARYLGKENESGTVAAGKIADLILLNANPLQSVSNTKKIEGVVLNGKWMDRKVLDAQLAKLAKK
jgi:imidazolonepropionase-like amidohydrolase